MRSCLKLLTRLVMHLMHWALLLLAMLFAPAGQAASKQVLVVLSEHTTPYKETAKALTQGLARAVSNGKLGLQVLLVDDPKWLLLSMQADTLLVPLGPKSAMAMANMKRPILAGLLTRQSFEQYFVLGATQHQQASALYLEQSLERYVQLVLSVQPQAKTLGVLFGPEQIASQPVLLELARQNAISLHSAHLHQRSEMFAALGQLLPTVEVLLLLPDAMVVHPESVRSLMLSALRQQVPTMAYSSDLVAAGALAAVFSTPQQSGQELAEMIQSMLPGKSWKPVPSAYPKYFTIQTNANVARSLKISLPEKVQSGQTLAPRTGL